MALTQVSAGFDGWSLIEWWNEFQNFLNTRKEMSYQVTPSGTDYFPHTTATDYTFQQTDMHLLVVNPGTIQLPNAAQNRGKRYGIVCVVNTSANWAADNTLLAPSGSDTVGFDAYLKLIHKQGSGSVLFRYPFFVTSDGVSNWVVHR